MFYMQKFIGLATPGEKEWVNFGYHEVPRGLDAENFLNHVDVVRLQGRQVDQVAVPQQGVKEVHRPALDQEPCLVSHGDPVRGVHTGRLVDETLDADLLAINTLIGSRLVQILPSAAPKPLKKT